LDDYGLGLIALLILAEDLVLPQNAQLVGNT
jgi:hypothetical protein